MKFKDTFGSQLLAGIVLIFIFAILIPVGLFLLIFKDFFAFIGRDFKIPIRRYNQGIFQHSKDLNSNALTIE